MFNNILLPTDGSEGSLRAAAIIANLAKANADACVTVLCAIATIDPRETDLDETVVAQNNSAVRAHAEHVVDTTCAVFEKHGVKSKGLVVPGDPVSASIVAQSRIDRFDVIAMASRGLTLKRNDRHYLGSITDHVLRQVDIPVLVIPIREEV